MFNVLVGFDFNKVSKLGGIKAFLTSSQIFPNTQLELKVLSSPPYGSGQRCICAGLDGTMCLCGKDYARGDAEPSVGTVGAFRGAERQHLLITQARAVIRTGCPQVRDAEMEPNDRNVEGKSTSPFLRLNVGDLGRV